MGHTLEQRLAWPTNPLQRMMMSVVNDSPPQ
jgi:hypothetical protein